MRGLAKFVGVSFVVLILLSIPAGYVLGSGSLHPLRRELTARQATEAKAELGVCWNCFARTPSEPPCGLTAS